MNKLSPIASELSCLMLSGLNVEFEDGRGLVIQGAGTVLLPGVHSIRDVILNEAVDSAVELSTIDYLSDAFAELPEDPPAACFTKLRDFRILVIAIERKDLERLLTVYATLWGHLSRTDQWDVALFTTGPEGGSFTQVSLSDAHNRLSHPAY